MIVDSAVVCVKLMLNALVSAFMNSEYYGIREVRVDMRLKELRARQLLSVRELAEQASISPSTISVIEKGHGRPALSTIRKLSKLFNIDPMDVDEFRDAIEARGRA